MMRLETGRIFLYSLEMKQRTYFEVLGMSSGIRVYKKRNSNRGTAAVLHLGGEFMHRDHPLYVAIALLVAIGIQLVLLWKLRSGVKQTTVVDHQTSDDN